MSEGLYQSVDQSSASSDKFHTVYGRRTRVILDRDWARRLGVMRTSGVYRISRQELVRRLASLPITTLSTPNGLFEADGSDAKPLLGSATPFRENAA